MKPRLLDLFCCAGGAGMGYARAGFEVVGVDLRPQPRYPFEFIQADVLGLDPEWVASFDAIHASPPCQIHSVSAHMHKGRDTGHVDLVPQTRAMLKASGRPYIIENVVGAPLEQPLMLCGTMFGLKVYRHRLFECSLFCFAPHHAQHTQGETLSAKGYSRHSSGAAMICVAGHNFNREDGAAAMGIDWPARREEIAQAIPPAYTEYLGRQIIAQIQQARAA